METQQQAEEAILEQLTSDDSSVRKEYLEHFAGDANEFSVLMAQAFVEWRGFDAGTKDDEERAHVSALIYTAITLHVLSLKLLLAGQTVAAGNLERQVIEAIAMALLCSSKKLPVLASFMANRYSSNVAVRDVLRHGAKLSLNKEALRALSEAQDFYHQYSHITKMTIAHGMSFSVQGGLYVGAAFDNGKLDAYKKEIQSRLSLAEVFRNFVQGVHANVSTW